MSQCGPFCLENSNPWTYKCNWEACSGCETFWHRMKYMADEGIVFDDANLVKCSIYSSDEARCNLHVIRRRVGVEPLEDDGTYEQCFFYYTGSETACASGKIHEKIYHKRLDNEQSWNEICGHGLCCRLVEPIGRRASEEKPAELSEFARASTRSPDVVGSHSSELEEEIALNYSAYARTYGPREYAPKPGVTFDRTNRPLVEAADVDDWVHPDGLMTRKIMSDIRLAKAMKTPFFIGAGYNRPHLPFACPKKYWDMYSASDIFLAPNPWLPVGAPPRSVHYFELLSYNEIERGDYNAGSGGPNGGQRNLPEGLSRELIHGYYACITYVDTLIGYLIDELKERQMYDETIITFASDHGYKLGNKGSWARHTVYETDLHVPMIIKAPPDSYTLSMTGTR
ncbi:hypothetical protein EMIHUDRAFT_247789 [Emiliania huxleyi CCMP1516]|uniref:Sulfatase N-terminal domain-containing protein n=2 Tax=Emiliania huxleyi TaxID=2903 RepID=A0A0D3IKC2_EMIH1|nr:hypothetical protein EMIHUDRAFT_247789 [Emiliania huxleyi CCMP1516]EOD11707.1 hypothetical protein EMIHUDRAFT_247789 [Emiliania huxleyi CCMP1516]|eukprot:XP_005764136.1 hypothetical protein EMIHUDRAFT_247789 [Emiliania huxleyi CCMP1516]